MLHSGERQVAAELSGIRRDHRARYEWAARRLPPGSRVLDLACGVGYGARILAEADHLVLGVDRDPETIAFANRHYGHPRARFAVGNAIAPIIEPGFGAAVSFETIEHLADPLPMLAALRRAEIPLLLASVPNEETFPFQGYSFHHRHYSRADFAELLPARVTP